MSNSLVTRTVKSKYIQLNGVHECLNAEMYVVITMAAQAT